MKCLQIRSWRRSAIRFAVVSAVLLQIAACSPENRELILYQYEVSFRNLLVRLMGDVLSVAFRA
jgi:hypothetical protein